MTADLAFLTRLSEFYTTTTSSEQPAAKEGKTKFVPGRTQIAIENVPDEFKAFAALTSAASLDLADFQYALTMLTIGRNNATLNDDELARATILRDVLGFPKNDPENVTLSFTIIPTDNGPLAVTRIQPQNYDASLAPIIFPTGLHHSVAVYLDFLQQLAIESGRQIIAFDIPGVGGSVPNCSVNQSILSESLITVIEATTKSNQAVVLMGHSAGTIGMRDLLYKQDVTSSPSLEVRNPVEQYVFLAPVPWGKDERKGLHFSKGYMLEGIGSLLSNGFRLESLAADGEKHYFNLHTEEDRQWLTTKTSTQSFPITPFAFLSALNMIAKQSLWDQMDNPKVVVVLADHDQIMRLKKPDDWQAKGAVILENADHSAIAGRDVNPEWVKQIAESIAE